RAAGRGGRRGAGRAASPRRPVRACVVGAVSRGIASRAARGAARDPGCVRRADRARNARRGEGALERVRAADAARLVRRGVAGRVGPQGRRRFARLLLVGAVAALLLHAAAAVGQFAPYFAWVYG